MISELHDHADEIAHICRQYRVLRLEAFGSAVTAESRDDVGDLDFLVEFMPCRAGQYFDSYFDLLTSLEGLFECPVDLVIAPAIRNPYFLDSVNRSRTILYAA